MLMIAMQSNLERRGGVRLAAWMGLSEGGQSHCRREDPRHRRIFGEVALCRLRGRDVPDQTDIGHRWRLAVTEFAGSPIVDELSFESDQRLDNPVPAPFAPLRFVKF